jgi:acetyl esterase
MPTTSSLVRSFERLEHQVARSLVSRAGQLPASLLGRLSRAADGAVLHPELAVLLGLQSLLGTKGLTARDVQRARVRMRRDARVHAGEPVAVGEVHELSYPGAASELPARRYLPRGAAGKKLPLLLFIHGGGFALGDLDTHDLPCRVLCQAGNVQVLSVTYRLAPEHPFPAGLDDVRAALRFARENADGWGADADKIAIGGDSAGGNLAAVATLLAKQAGEPLPALQLLIYPAVDSTRDSASMDAFAEGLLLTRADIHWFRDSYLRAVKDRGDPRVSPLLAPDLSGLPRAVVISAGFDPLRDEGEAYARALEAAGNQVVQHRFPGLVHGFINLGAVSPASRTALAAIAQLMREQLAR